MACLMVYGDLLTETEQHYTRLGTVENHGNTEMTETVIFVKCCDFVKMPCFWVKMPCFNVFTIVFCF